MKKLNNFTKLTALLVLFLASLGFTGCFDPVFYQINQDVVSESALVSGSITSIARFTINSKEYLVLSGGNTDNLNGGKLLYKEITSSRHGEWKKYNSLPFSTHHYDYYGSQDHLGQQIIKVLADSDTLYLVTAEYENNTDEGTNCPKWIHLWAGQGSDWGSITWTDLNKHNAANTHNYFPFYESSSYTFSKFNVFSTNSPKAANREVYIRSGTGSSAKYYQVSGTTISTDITSSITSKVYGGSFSTEASVNVNSAVKLGSTTIFLNSVAVTSNETYTTDADKFYYSSGSKLYLGTAASGDSNLISKCDTGSTIASLAFCQDAILVGCGNYNATTTTSSGGIKKVALTAGVPSTSLSGFTTNAQSQLLSSYIVMCLLNATPEDDELDSILYATLNFVGTGTSSTATFDSVGLWSYYPGRGNWNRE